MRRAQSAQKRAGAAKHFDNIKLCTAPQKANREREKCSRNLSRVLPALKNACGAGEPSGESDTKNFF